MATVSALLFLNQLFFPVYIYGLTGGPSQPEVQSFEPVGTSDMVDIFSGDFNYNIPLMDVGGYPINIAYHGGVGMDQEASWVGLGWNLNPGVINRNMRGIPDDFSGGGDKIKKEAYMKPNVTVSANGGVSGEVFGLPFSKLKANFGITNNTYRGWGLEYSVTPEFNLGSQFEAEMTFGFSTFDGADIDVGLSTSFSGELASKENNLTGKSGSLRIGSGINSRGGMKSLNLGMNYTLSMSNAEGKVMNTGLGGSTQWNFGTQTYTTKISNPQRQLGMTYNGTMGTEFFGLHPAVSVGGSFSYSSTNHSSELPAYGYMYEHNKNFEKKPNEVLLDFNRENDNGLNDKSTNLPVTNHTFDIYSVSGQGVGGSYRTYRGDVGILHDHNIDYGSFSYSAGVELGVGNLAHSGAQAAGTFTKTKYGKWDKDNGLVDKFGFVAPGQKGNSNYEAFYFKPAGEMTVADEVFFNKLKGSTPVQADITPITGEASGAMIRKGQKSNLTGSIASDYFYPGQTPNDNTKTQRDSRQKPMSVFTNDEAKFCFEQHIYQVPQNAAYNQGVINRNPISLENRSKHHVREVVITNEDGSRYVYGIPAYNNKQIEQSFNVSRANGSHLTSGTCIDGQANYSSGDNSRQNKNGEDHLFSSTEIPAYAHSYLLTSVVSPDYVDVQGDGITDDDFGTAVKFNYTRVHENYRWRTPYKTNKANYQEGMKSKRTDDKGSIVYGEKEVWHVHSIESKNQVALFKISTREDAHGVQGINGGLDANMKSYKLDRIEIYNKQDLINNGTNAEPIKIVYFEYDYSLCPDVENNSGANVTGNTNKGKLTLKRIYFTYGKSSKGKFSPYKFKYSDFNPSYNLKGNDMWGNYKPIPNGATCDHTGPALNNEFAYSSQIKADADMYASAWSLTEIFLPSGGSIKVQYESDDYAYVQDKKAMQMMQIEGFGRVNSSGGLDAPANQRAFLHRWNNGSALHQDAILFKLPVAINSGNALADKNKFFETCIKNVKDLQVTVFADIDGKTNYEYIKSYIETDAGRGYGLDANGTIGWVAMKRVGFGDKRGNGSEKVNPVSRAAWNFARMNCDYLINPPTHIDDDNDPSKNKGKILRILPIGKDLVTLFAGYNRTLFMRGFCAKIKTERSWVRMNTPNGKKLGGGHRVKKILINDNWTEMGAANSGATSMEYGQEYTYTTNENGNIISSGVASNEPDFSDENPLKIPRNITIENKLAPNETIMQDEPVGQSFYPGAGIGYAKVSVKNIGRTNVKRTGTGMEVSEFYTAKDFPTIVKETDIRIEKFEPPKIFQMFKARISKTISASQGYTIELNDMHGKPKSKFSYREGEDKPYAGSSYVYKTKLDENKRIVLDNTVPVIFPNGQISNKMVGVDYDVSQDMNEYKTTTTHGGANLNVDNMYLVITVMSIPTIYPSFKRNKTTVRTSVTTKIVNRYAVLDKTIAYQEGSSIETQNRLWDAHTGQVVLSSVQNEFKDNIYNFNYPAHWAYDGMGHAYKNDGVVLYDAKIYQNRIELPGGLNPKNFLVPGDEVAVYYGGIFNSYSHKAWVYDGADGVLNLIKSNGEPVMKSPTSRYNVTLKVMRSGRRNMQTTTVGSITSLANPISGSSLNFTQVLNAEAAEFSDDWKTHLDYISKRKCNASFTDTGQELINLLTFMAQNNKLNYNYLIKNINSRTNSQPQDSVWIWKEGAWQFSGITGVNGGFVAADSCNKKLKMKLSTKNNQVVEFRSPYKYYSNNPVDFYNVYLECVGSAFAPYNIANNTWNPSWLPTSKLFSVAPDISQLIITKVNAHTMRIRTETGICEFLIECDVPFNNISDLFDFTVLDSRILGASAIVKRKDCVIDTVQVRITNSCFNVGNCIWECRNSFTEGLINPYTSNMRGVWRPKKNYKYLDNRNYQSATVNPKTDGTYSSFAPYWQYNGTQQKYVPTSNQKWVWASEVSKYSPFGSEVETKDALGKYSAALYAYNYTHPVAVASNSQYKQIAFDGFEDYNYMSTYAAKICQSNHFNFRDAIALNQATLDNTYAHSGKHSLKVNSGNTAVFDRQVSGITTTAYTGFSENVARIAKETDNLGYFCPSQGKYLLGAWVRASNKQADSTYIGAKIKVTLTDNSGGTTVQIFEAKDHIIEGWQRIEGSFEVMANTKFVKIELIADGADAWFDDIRIHPTDGNMATYVYDNRTLRLMAELDANNYATFYEYSNEGELVRVKKETIKGIQTLKEVKASSVKKPHNGIFNP